MVAVMSITARDNKGRIVKGSNHIHGMSDSPEYDCWVAMRARCNKPNHPNYRHYGGRGITVSDRWEQSFMNFYADMGSRPSPKHTIERIDVNKGYGPDNCVWATHHRQQLNRRNNNSHPGMSYEPDRKAWNVRITVNGKRINLGRFKDFDEALAARKKAEENHAI